MIANNRRLRLPDSPRAVFSPCERYRYVLWRECGALFSDRYALFIGLNPSTATEHVDDPTIRREVDFCTRWGYGWLCKVNLFGFRATDPHDMKAQIDPNGPENDDWIRRMADDADLIVVAWGNDGAHQSRARAVNELLKPHTPRLVCLGITKTGEPRHPLYVSSLTESIPYRPLPARFQPSPDTADTARGPYAPDPSRNQPANPSPQDQSDW